MKKKDAFKIIRNKKGYIPYIKLFDLYDDNDNIPKNLINLECKKDIPNGNFIIVNQNLYEQIKKLT